MAIKKPIGMWLLVPIIWFLPFWKRWAYKCLTHEVTFTDEREWHEHLINFHNTKEVQR